MGIRKHNRCGTPEYRSWQHMRSRCNNLNNQDYRYYGGRGIKVCERWNDFSLFYKDMGDKPGKDYTLDRINNEGNYEPSNCKWSNRLEQRLNNSQRIFVDYDGSNIDLFELSDICGLEYKILYERITVLGWSIEQASQLPKNVRGIVCSYGGSYYTLKSLCSELGLNKNTTLDRINYTNKPLGEVFGVSKKVEIFKVVKGVVQPYTRLGYRDRPERRNKKS